MADEKLTAQTEATSLAGTDILYVVVDPGGTPLSRKITKANLKLVDISGTPVANDFARFTDGVTIEGRSYSETLGDLGLQNVYKKTGTVWNPVAVQGDDTQVMVFRADAALTITRIHISGPNASPGAELDIDLKWADNTTAFTTATVIDICDTTSGVVTITAGFDDATILPGKYVYWEFGAAPHADWLWFWFEIWFSYD